MPRKLTYCATYYMRNHNSESNTLMPSYTHKSKNHCLISSCLEVFTHVKKMYYSMERHTAERTTGSAKSGCWPWGFVYILTRPISSHIFASNLSRFNCYINHKNSYFTKHLIPDENRCFSNKWISTIWK